MSNVEIVDREFVIKHWEAFRGELEETVRRYVELEHYALLSTGAIWTWLASATNADWNPALKWLPLLINALFSLRALGLILRTRDITNYLKSAEDTFQVPVNLKLERKYSFTNPKMLTMYAFWLLLIAATSVLPFYYELKADAPGPIVIPLG